MRINFRTESKNTEHVRFTVFIDGKNTGQLCMDPMTHVKLSAFVMAGVNELGTEHDQFEETVNFNENHT